MDRFTGSPDTVGVPSRMLIDGHPGDLISARDRGLHYGDGLFETMRIHSGRLCQWQRHLNRLALGAERLGIPMPNARILEAETQAVTQGQDEGVLKLILSRGSGGRGYQPPSEATASRILLSYPLAPATEPSWENGVTLRYCETPVSVNPALAGIKHLNRLDSVLARAEWDDPGIAEGLMLDASGAVIGGTMTNLFLWDGKRLLTPSVDRSGIAGTVRGLTLELAVRADIDCLVTRLDRAALDQARGLFLTNAVVGVWPVRALARRQFDLGDLPWSLLQTLYHAARAPG